jgi:putative heme-binding domain-containing protein
LAGEGATVGPDLAGARGAGKLWLLTNILAPNRHVAPAFANHAVTLKTGEMLQGLIFSENPASVLLRRAGGVDAQLLRRNIETIDNLRISLMPEGLEAGLNLQDVADLLEFIAMAR